MLINVQHSFPNFIYTCINLELDDFSFHSTLFWTPHWLDSKLTSSFVLPLFTLKTLQVAFPNNTSALTITFIPHDTSILKFGLANIPPISYLLHTHSETPKLLFEEVFLSLDLCGAEEGILSSLTSAQFIAFQGIL